MRNIRLFVAHSLPRCIVWRIDDGAQKSDLVYIVIWVHGGVIYAVAAHRDKKTAQVRKRFYKKNFNPGNDEVGIFEVEIGKHADED